MSMVLVSYAVKRVLYRKHQIETYAVFSGRDEKIIENGLKNNKNVIHFYKVNDRGIKL